MVEDLDERVISKMHSEDHAGLRFILERQVPQLMAYATLMKNFVMDSENIAQDTFVRLWTQRLQYDPKD